MQPLKIQAQKSLVAVILGKSHSHPLPTLAADQNSPGARAPAALCLSPLFSVKIPEEMHTAVHVKARTLLTEAMLPLPSPQEQFSALLYFSCNH